MIKSSLDVITAIRMDKTGGASSTGCALAQACRDLCEQCDFESLEQLRSSLYELFIQAIDAQPTMATVKFVANEVALIIEKALSKDVRQDVAEVCAEISEKCSHLIQKSHSDVPRISMMVARALPDGGTIVTLSLSRTVIESLRTAKAAGKDLTLCILESRPGCEGIDTAHKIMEIGHNVILVPDASMYTHVRSAKCVLVGADALLASGDTINKVGTAAVAACAKTCGVPVWVAAESWKYDILSRLGMYPAIAQSPDTNPFGTELPQGMGLDRRMFEVVERSHLDLLITEMGVGSPDAVVAWGSTISISQFLQSLL